MQGDYHSVVTETVDQAVLRQRGRRLVIIVVVIALLLVAILAWGRLTGESLDKASDAAQAELREVWRSVDLRKLNVEYANETTKAWESGNYGRAVRLFPRVEDADFLSASFERGDVVEARYIVSASGRERCLLVRVEGPAPNAVRILQVDRC